jgi:ATP-dependent RNA circularization protein (DNA/RNA ligase family)
MKDITLLNRGVFDEEAFNAFVVRANSDILHLKYPRTYHLPFSEGSTNDDKKLKTDEDFRGKYVIITEKLDGENTSMTHDKIWARSVDSGHHPSRNWINSLWNVVKYDIPPNLRICGENMYAKHSLYYDKLESYFYVFSIWDGDTCLSWNETVEWCALLDLKHVPVVYSGIYDAVWIYENHNIKSLFGDEREGLVVRVPESFNYQDFASKLTKIVRKKHVQTSQHWMYDAIVPNKLKY